MVRQERTPDQDLMVAGVILLAALAGIIDALKEGFS
jgi:hypothetical protein